MKKKEGFEESDLVYLRKDIPFWKLGNGSEERIMPAGQQCIIADLPKDRDIGQRIILEVYDEEENVSWLAQVNDDDISLDYNKY